MNAYRLNSPSSMRKLSKAIKDLIGLAKIKVAEAAVEIKTISR